jgi:DNA-binding transcriptional MerR regulator
MVQVWRVRRFAALTGVTVKALHHYDRLGLLQPARTSKGYRVYSTTDLERLEQIVALRFLGVPLGKMRGLLDRSAAPLESTLRRQRDVLEDQKRRLDLALDALRGAERSIAAGAPRDGILQTIIRVITMQDIDVMRKYFSDDAWPMGREHFGDWPSAKWQALYRDVAASLESDPAGDAAQALADRWLALSLAEASGSGLRAGLHRAWADREHWPPALKRRIAEFDIERATRYINEALWTRWDRERQAQQSTGTSAPPRVSERRQVLYRDCAAILDENPSGQAARTIVARWQAIVDDECGGDEETKTALLKSYRRHATWPAAFKRYWAALYRMDAATWERVADFIDRARVCQPAGPRRP